MHSDARHMAMLGGVRDDAWTKDYLQRNLAHWDAHGFGLWMLRLDEGGAIIGRCLLRHLDLDGVDEIETGYSFEPDQWGLGFATEIAVACVAIGRSTFRYASIVAVTRPENLASRRVLEKAGLRFEREMPYAGAPHVLYRTTDNPAT